MDAKQRTHEIEMMARLLTESGDLEYMTRSSAPRRYEIGLWHTWSQVLPAVEAHAYLSGALDAVTSRAEKERG